MGTSNKFLPSPSTILSSVWASRVVQLVTMDIPAKRFLRNAIQDLDSFINQEQRLGIYPSELSPSLSRDKALCCGVVLLQLREVTVSGSCQGSSVATGSEIFSEILKLLP